MTSFADLNARLNLKIDGFSRGLENAARDVRRFGRNINGYTNDASEAIDSLNKKTSAWGLNMKSVSRVVSGIIISQTFYNAAQAIDTAATATWEFTKQLEYAKIAYSNLFGDTSLALEFINVLKDFAAKTPFTFTEAESAAKRLLAYGVDYSNIMYVMQGVMSAASAQGDPQRIEQISRAIGQIFTYGKLMTAEVRQLTEAGIPVYDILQEKLGLTQEQLRNLGHESIPASKAINALIDGINERFGNVVTASSKTITGIISNIKDNATMLASGLLDPLTVVIKSALAEVGAFLYDFRDIMETSGAGGVFEALFPAEMHGVLRQFAANFKAIHAATLALVVALGGFLKPILEALLRLYNALAPVLTTVTNVFAGLVYGITSNATAMKILTAAIAAAATAWVVFKTKAIAAVAVTAVINAISKSLLVMRTALNLLVAHPFWLLMMAIGGVLVGISGGFGAISDKVNGLFKQLTKFNGVDPDKILLPSQKERANDLEKFNEKLDGTADAMDNLSDATGKAGKAAKAARGLLSFDEVFKLNEPDETTGSGAGDIVDPNLEDMLGGFGGLGDAYIPEVPDFSVYVNAVLDGLRAAWEKIKEYASVIVGAGLGAIIGGILGGIPGAKIGLAIGALAGGIWKKIADSLGVVPTQELSSVANAVATGAVQFVRRIIVEFVKNLVPTFTNGVFSGFSRMVGFSITGALSSALKQGIAGAIVSLGAGLLTNAITAWIASELDMSESDLNNAGVGQMVGGIAGMIIGMFFGPVGSLVGGAIGQFIGSMLGLFWEPIKAFFQDAAIALTEGFVVVFNSLTAIGEGIRNTWDGVVESTGERLGKTLAVVSAKWSDISTSISDFLSTIGNNVSAKWSEYYNVVSTVCSDIWSGITTVWNDISDGLQRVHDDISYLVSYAWNSIKDIITQKVTESWEEIKQKYGWIFDIIKLTVTMTFEHVKQYFTNMYENIKMYVMLAFTIAKMQFDAIYDNIKTNVTNAYNSVSSVFTSIYTTIRDLVTSAYTSVSTKFNDMYIRVKALVETILIFTKRNFLDMYNDIKTNVSNAYSVVTSNFSNMYEKTKTKIGDMYKSVKEGVANIYNVFKDWISDMWSNVFDKLFGWVDDAIDSLRDFFDMKSEADSYDSSDYVASGPGHNANYGPGYSLAGHATGGIFNREHVARFAEGNKAEAIIPLENNTAMQPFVDAISRGIIEGLAPTIMQVGGTASNNMPPMYVGTLIADERGLKQLYKKFELIQVQENARRGLA